MNQQHRGVGIPRGEAELPEAHGRGHLKRDVDEMLAATVLLENLKRTEYGKIVYGGFGEDDLAARFSHVDPAHVADVMRSWRQERSTCRLPRKLERSKGLPDRLTGFIRAVGQKLRKGA